MELIVFLVIGAVVFFSTMVFIVPQQRAYILETFGKAHKSHYGPGFHVKWPVPIAIIRAKLDLRVLEVRHPVTSRSKDNAFVEMPVTVQYRVVNPHKATYELEDPQEQIVSYILNAVRRAVPSHTLDGLFEQRGDIERSVQEELLEQFAGYGFEIVNVLVDEPQPSMEVKEAYNAIITNERLETAAKHEAGAIRARLVGEAEAQAESKRLAAIAIAQAAREIALGRADAIQTLSKAGVNEKEALAFLETIIRIDGVVDASKNGSLILMNNDDGGRVSNDQALLAQLVDAQNNSGKKSGK
ncbi:MAG: SPFH domain-containing protein [Alphaproteobacteria bacterium]